MLWWRKKKLECDPRIQLMKWIAEQSKDVVRAMDGCSRDDSLRLRGKTDAYHETMKFLEIQIGAEG